MVPRMFLLLFVIHLGASNNNYEAKTKINFLDEFVKFENRPTQVLAYLCWEKSKLIRTQFKFYHKPEVAKTWQLLTCLLPRISFRSSHFEFPRTTSEIICIHFSCEVGVSLSYPSEILLYKIKGSVAHSAIH